MELQKNKNITKSYLLIVVLLMLVLPVVSVFIEQLNNREQLSFIDLVGKEFVFWAIGIRLLTAGAKQVINPSFTAESIFHIKAKESFVIVRELGFSNICLGILGTASLFLPQWRIAAACTGGLYMGIAGVQHIIKKPVSGNEWVALISDIFIFVLMAVYVSIVHSS